MTYLRTLLMIIVVSLIGGCSPGDSQDNSKMVIGVLLADTSDQFQVYLMDGMKEAADKDAEIEVVYMDGKYDAGRQLQQAENLIAQDVSALVLMAVDSVAAQPILSAANDAKIPVVLVNRKIPHQEHAVAYVGSEDVVAGEIEMSAVAEALEGKGRIVVLEGTYGHEPQVQRKRGYDNILKKFPDIELVAAQTGKWYRNEAMAVMENWLQADLKINGVVAQNDEMALGALKAIEDAGLLGTIVVAGIDATPEALKYVREGQLNITVFQDAKGQGRAAIEVAAEVARGNPVEKEMLIPFELVTSGTADSYEQRYR
ncbi:MAG TPA: sugar ABC transporter substrate-binding protein [Verrucomicrobiales bacterium]|nr:sugar ABC transporter substrate-binding protein [Verrucomicrobiales bacterium]